MLKGCGLAMVVTLMMEEGKGMGNVTEFVPLHDIPYILLSPNSQPYLSIKEFLASLDQHQDLSAFVPNASFP